MEAKNSAEEKRGAPRVQKLFMIAYLPFEDGPVRTPISLGCTVDISPSGVGMEVYKEVAVDTVMEMEIDLEGLSVPAWGKVVRADLLENGNYHIGIRFDEEQELLQAKIALAEIASLLKQKDELEEVLARLVRTGWPWDEHGQPNGILGACKDGYAPAMLAARKLLGRAKRSMVARPAPNFPTAS
jgi:PilZ domain-containing protein